jgi:hypothetical protein
MLRNLTMFLTLAVLSLEVFGASSRPFPYPDCRSGVCKDEASVRPFPYPDCRSGVCKD